MAESRYSFLFILKINIQHLPSSSSIKKILTILSVLRNLSIDFSICHANHLISIIADHHSIRRYLQVPTIPLHFPQCSVGPVRCSAAWPCCALFRSDVKRPPAPENWCGWFRDTAAGSPDRLLHISKSELVVIGAS